MAETHPQDRVFMTHPKVHTNKDVTPATVTREAFDAVWKDKGWKLEEVSQPAESPVPTVTVEEFQENAKGGKKS